MGAAQTEWARKLRDKLREALGNKCVDCGKIEDLEFDVIHPLDDKDPVTGKQNHHRKMSWDTRMRFYRTQHENGNLALRCSPCNSRKSDVPLAIHLEILRARESQAELAGLQLDDVPF